MYRKIVKSVCLKNEIKTFAEVEDRGAGIIRLTINGVNSSASIHMDRNQALAFFSESMDLIDV